jgi:phosphoserine phosphatase
MVEGAAEVFGIPADRVVGVRSEEQDGRLTARVLAPVTVGEGKRAALAARLDGRRPALAMGDTWTDYELLLWAERAVFVDTGRDGRLAATLAARGVAVQPALLPYGSSADLPVV